MASQGSLKEFCANLCEFEFGVAICTPMRKMQKTIELLAAELIAVNYSVEPLSSSGLRIQNKYLACLRTITFCVITE